MCYNIPMIKTWIKHGKYSPFATMWIDNTNFIVRQCSEWTGNYSYLVNGYCNKRYDTLAEAMLNLS